MKPNYKNLGKVSLSVEDYWNNANIYERLSIVVNGDTGRTYVSKKDVPAGVDIDNREYWLPFGMMKDGTNYVTNTELDDALNEKVNNDLFYTNINSIINSINKKANKEDIPTDYLKTVPAATDDSIGGVKSSDTFRVLSDGTVKINAANINFISEIYANNKTNDAINIDEILQDNFGTICFWFNSSEADYINIPTSSGLIFQNKWAESSESGMSLYEYDICVSQILFAEDGVYYRSKKLDPDSDSEYYFGVEDVWGTIYKSNNNYKEVKDILLGNIAYEDGDLKLNITANASEVLECCRHHNNGDYICRFILNNYNKNIIVPLSIFLDSDTPEIYFNWTYGVYYIRLVDDGIMIDWDEHWLEK